MTTTTPTTAPTTTPTINSLGQGTISATGIGSGLDVNGIVTQLMNIESQPLTALNAQEAGYQAQLSAYGSLKGAVSAFQTSVSALSDPSQLQGMRAVSADNTVFTAAASSSAAAGNYNVQITHLAQAQKLASSVFTNTTDVIGTGSLTFQFGTYSGGVFTASSAKTAQTVTIDSAHNTLLGIQQAVNAANIGVTATILNDGTGNRLVFTSNATGAANSLKITVSDTTDSSNTDNAGFSQLAYDPTGTLGNGKNLSETVTAQDALLNVDGINNITKASNTITDVIQGVTLTLLSQSAANTPTALTVTNDTSSIQSSVSNFVNGYNALRSAVTSLTSYDPTTQTAALLQGDYSANSILDQARNTLNGSLTGLNSAFTNLSQIGVSFQVDGTLSLNTTTLQNALSTNPHDIAGLFANIGQTSDSLVNYAGATDKTQAGNYSVYVSQLATHGSLNGVTTAGLANTAGTFTTPLTIDTTNNTLNVTIDGVQSGTITLTQGTYATAAALTAEIQSKINGDATLASAGKTATVSFDSVNNRLVISSDGYGSAANVGITSVGTGTASTLGLSVGTGTAGVDVAGTINGAAATGSGQTLTGATGTATEGLQLQIIGGATGSRGTVNYSQGYAYQLNTLATQFLSSTGPIASREAGINSTINDTNNRITALNQQLATIQQNYMAQFTALDTLIAQMKTTSDYLTQQLSVLPAPYMTNGVSSVG